MEAWVRPSEPKKSSYSFFWAAREQTGHFYRARFVYEVMRQSEKVDRDHGRIKNNEILLAIFEAFRLVMKPKEMSVFVYSWKIVLWKS